MNKEKKSISQLEGWFWNSDIPAKTDSTYEEYNFYLLHDKPITEYSAGDVYFMIGQESGLKYLVSIAIDYLSNNFLIKADDYPGDLLGRVVRLEKEFWQQNPTYYNVLIDLIEKQEGYRLPNPDVINDINKTSQRAVSRFLELRGEII